MGFNSAFKGLIKTPCLMYVILQTNYKLQILKEQDQALSNTCLYLFGTGSRGSSTATQNDTQVPIERLVLPHPIRQAVDTTLAAKDGYNINFPWVLSITPYKRSDNK